MEKILITGANGMLGGKIIRQIMETTDFDVVAVAASKDKIEAMSEREAIGENDRIHFLSNEAFLSGEITEALSGIGGAVHLAFSRRIRPASDIAASIDFSERVFHRFTEIGAERIINLSTQAVYGNVNGMRKETMDPAPESIYAMAKYATERIFELCMKTASIQNYTSLRLDLVVQSQNLIPDLCRQAKEGMIQLRGGKQRYSFIDADDAALAVVSMLKRRDRWERIYNVGWNQRQYTLLEIAEMIAEAAERIGYGRPAIRLDEQNIVLWYGMDSSKFMEFTGWNPSIGLTEMIVKIMQREG